jgi:RNA polymerase sigma factor (sigma-70 family)
MKEDKIIWEDFKKGDKNALSQIYYQNVDLLYRYGKKLSTDDELVKDTIQDLFFDLIRTRDNLGTTNNIRFYLIKAFRRRLIRNCNKPDNRLTIVDGSELQAEIVYSVEDDLISREELTHREQMILQGLKAISPKEREILYYRFTCDFEYDQICEIMSLKYDSARKQVFRAIKALKDKLPDKNHFLFLFFLIFAFLLNK